MRETIAKSSCNKKFASEYLLLNSKKFGLLDVCHILFSKDLEKREFIDGSTKSLEECRKHRWIIFASIVAQQLLLLIAARLHRWQHSVLQLSTSSTLSQLITAFLDLSRISLEVISICCLICLLYYTPIILSFRLIIRALGFVLVFYSHLSHFVLSIKLHASSDHLHVHAC